MVLALFVGGFLLYLAIAYYLNEYREKIFIKSKERNSAYYQFLKAKETKFLADKIFAPQKADFVKISEHIRNNEASTKGLSFDWQLAWNYITLPFLLLLLASNFIMGDILASMGLLVLALLNIVTSLNFIIPSPFLWKYSVNIFFVNHIFIFIALVLGHSSLGENDPNTILNITSALKILVSVITLFMTMGVAIVISILKYFSFKILKVPDIASQSNRVLFDVILEKNDPFIMTKVMENAVEDAPVFFHYAFPLALQYKQIQDDQLTDITYKGIHKQEQPDKWSEDKEALQVLYTYQDLLPQRTVQELNLILKEYDSDSQLFNELLLLIDEYKLGAYELKKIRDYRKDKSTSKLFRILIAWIESEGMEKVQLLLASERELSQKLTPPTRYIIPLDWITQLLKSHDLTYKLIAFEAIAEQCKWDLLISIFLEYEKLFSVVHNKEDQQKIFRTFVALCNKQKQIYPKSQCIFCPESYRFAKPAQFKDIPLSFQEMLHESGAQLYLCPNLSPLDTYIYPIRQAIGYITESPFMKHHNDELILGLWDEANKTAHFAEISSLEVDANSSGLHLDWAIASLLQKMNDANWKAFKINVASGIQLTENTQRLINEWNTAN